MDPIRIAGIPQACGQTFGQTETTFGLARQHQTAVEGRRHPLTANGWKIEEKRKRVSSDMATVAVSLRESEPVWATNSYTISTNYATTAKPTSHPHE